MSKKIKNPSPLAIPQFFPSASSGREPVERNLHFSILYSLLVFNYPANPVILSKKTCVISVPVLSAIEGVEPVCHFDAQRRNPAKSKYLKISSALADSSNLHYSFFILQFYPLSRQSCPLRCASRRVILSEKSAKSASSAFKNRSKLDESSSKFYVFLQNFAKCCRILLVSCKFMLEFCNFMLGFCKKNLKICALFANI
ncbi:MAG: hypothetical protein WCW64_09285 [Phycisphaerae bacterium]